MSDNTRIFYVDFKQKRLDMSWDERRNLSEKLETMRKCTEIMIKMLKDTDAPQNYIDKKRDEFNRMLKSNYKRVFPNE